MIFHDTLAITPKGVPLGLLDCQVWSRDPKVHGKKVTNRNKPIEEKESNKWLKSFQAVEKLAKDAPQTTWVSVGDRKQALLNIAVLGGFVKGKGKEPGAKVIWRGLKRLHDMSVMFSIMNNIKYEPEIDYGHELTEESDYD